MMQTSKSTSLKEMTRTCSENQTKKEEVPKEVSEKSSKSTEANDSKVKDDTVSLVDEMRENMIKIKGEVNKVYKKHSPNNRELTWPIVRKQLIMFEIELNKYTSDMEIDFLEPLSIFRKFYRIFDRQPKVKIEDSNAQQPETILGK